LENFVKLNEEKHNFDKYYSPRSRYGKISYSSGESKEIIQSIKKDLESVNIKSSDISYDKNTNEASFNIEITKDLNKNLSKKALQDLVMSTESKSSIYHKGGSRSIPVKLPKISELQKLSPTDTSPDGIKKAKGAMPKGWEEGLG